jgi:hypothetical protein
MTVAKGKLQHFGFHAYPGLAAIERNRVAIIAGFADFDLAIATRRCLTNSRSASACADTRIVCCGDVDQIVPTNHANILVRREP